MNAELLHTYASWAWRTSLDALPLALAALICGACSSSRSRILNAAAFAKMKKGALIVNTARGPLIDEPALIAALDSGHLGGAALDVVTTEPLAKDSALLGRDNVILTPHTAFYSVEALNELQTKCASDVARVLSGEKPIYPIKA